MVSCQAHVGLLLAIRSNQSVYFRGLHIVKLFYCILDLTLVRFQIDNEHQSIVFLNLFHGRLCVQWRYDRPELIHTGSMRHRLARVLGIPSQTKGLWSVEGDREASFPGRVTMSTL